MPVAHGDNGAGGNVRPQGVFQGARLLFGEAANGRATADFHVVQADDFGPHSENPFIVGFAGDEGSGEINDVWIAEEIVEKRFDRGLAIGAAELKEHHRDLFWPAHVAPLANSSSAAAIAA